MNTEAIKRAVLFGIAGTVAMTVFSYIAQSIHLPKIDVHDMINGVIHMGTAAVWIVYFVVGVVFAYLYKAYFQAKLPTHSWIRGVFYAFFLWAVMGLVMPFFGMGFFTGEATTAMGMLLGFSAYGATVGYLYELR